MQYDQNGHLGKLTVTVRLAREALPVEGVSVLITGTGKEEGTVYFSLLTDRSGSTPAVPLPAPPAANSLTPDESPVCAVYRVLTEKEGYLGVRILSVPVFDGVGAIQNVSLLPLPAGAPRGTLRYYGPDDTDLTEKEAYDG